MPRRSWAVTISLSLAGPFCRTKSSSGLQASTSHLFTKYLKSIYRVPDAALSSIQNALKPHRNSQRGASSYPFCRKGHRGTERLISCLRSHRCWRWSRFHRAPHHPCGRLCHTLDRGPPGQIFPSLTWEPRCVQMAADASWPQAPISDQEANPDWSKPACNGPTGGAELNAYVPGTCVWNPSAHGDGTRRWGFGGG